MRISLAEGLDYYLRSYNSYVKGWGLKAKPLITEVHKDVENFLKVLSIARSLAVGNQDLQEVYDAIAEHSINLYESIISMDTQLAYNSEVFIIAFQESFNSFLNYADDVDFRVFVTPFYTLSSLQDIHTDKGWKFPKIDHYIKQYEEHIKSELIATYEKDYLKEEAFYEIFKQYKLEGKLTTDFRKKD